MYLYKLFIQAIHSCKSAKTNLTNLSFLLWFALVIYVTAIIYLGVNNRFYDLSKGRLASSLVSVINDWFSADNLILSLKAETFLDSKCYIVIPWHILHTLESKENISNFLSQLQVILVFALYCLQYSFFIPKTGSISPIWNRSLKIFFFLIHPFNSSGLENSRSLSKW